jgi:hypothetical protein
MRTKADVSRPLQIYGFTPLSAATLTITADLLVEDGATCRSGNVRIPIVSLRRRGEDSESFNQLVRIIPLRTKGYVMSNLDRVSGSFLAVIVGGLAILCGGLIVIVVGF